jgi:septation ring formation regulator EzrA
MAKLLKKAAGSNLADQVIRELCLYQNMPSDEITVFISRISPENMNELQTGLQKMREQGFDFTPNSEDMMTFLDGDEEDMNQLTEKYQAQNVSGIIEGIFEMM